MRRAKFLSWAILPAVALALAGGSGARCDDSARKVYQQTLQATGLVCVPAANGTGWVLDVKERLLLTNHHVVANGGVKDTVDVVFPAYGKDGKAIVTTRHYLDERGLPTRRTVRGTVIDTDPRRDLALIRLDTIPEGVTSLAPAAASPEPGERLHSVGNPAVSAGLWVYTQGAVRVVAHRAIRYGTTQLVDCLVVETQSPINPGDSGGPVVNDKGELAGVTSGFHRDGRLVSFCIDVTEVRKFAAEARKFLDPRTAKDYRLRGQNYGRKGRYDRALADLNEALRLDPDDDVALHERGWAYYKKEEYDRALADLTRALALVESPATYQVRGLVFLAKGDHDAAIADLKESLKLNPKSAVAYHYLGRAYYYKKDYDEAIKHTTAAIRLDPQDAAAYAYRGYAYHDKKDYDRALENYNQSLRLNPRDVHVWRYRGWVYRTRGDYDKAVADFNQALALTPNSPHLYNDRGYALRLRGDVAAAVADYTRAISLKPDFALAYYNRSVAFRKLGKKEQAGADYNKAIQLDPSLAN
jgi:tetratricopeptide (TPR) repeat protein